MNYDETDAREIVTTIYSGSYLGMCTNIGL